jgi:predicted HicB family RNase H-like nuclease
MSKAPEHGHLPDETSVTEELLQELTTEAEAGYDLAARRRKRAGRPPLGTGVSTVESVRLDPDLKRELLARAAHYGVSVSELIRTALRTYVQAS